MTEPPEIEELAKRYLDLWQDHVSGLSEDPEWIAAMTRLFSTFWRLPTRTRRLNQFSTHFNTWLGGTFETAITKPLRAGPSASTDPSADSLHGLHSTNATNHV